MLVEIQRIQKAMKKQYTVHAKAMLEPMLPKILQQKMNVDPQLMKPDTKTKEKAMREKIIN